MEQWILVSNTFSYVHLSAQSHLTTSSFANFGQYDDLVDSEISGSLCRLLKQLSSVYNPHMRNVIKNIVWFTLFLLLLFPQSLNDYSEFYFTAVHHTSVYRYGCIAFRLLAMHSSSFCLRFSFLLVY